MTEASDERAVLTGVELCLTPGPGVEQVALTWADHDLVLRSLEHRVPVSLGGAVPKRRAEFAVGRQAAALALARFGCTIPLRRNSDGSPGWPVGFVGSISHTECLAVAAVARADSHLGLGIDIEQIVSAATFEELAARVLAPDEHALLCASLPQVDARTLFSLGFSVKESLFKCLYPLCAEFFDFEDAELTQLRPRDTARGDVELRLTRALPGGFNSGFSLRGRYALGTNHVETTVVLERHAP